VDTVWAHAYSILWSVREQETPCFVFQGTNMCTSSNAILTVIGKKLIVAGQHKRKLQKDHRRSRSLENIEWQWQWLY